MKSDRDGGSVARAADKSRGVCRELGMAWFKQQIDCVHDMIFFGDVLINEYSRMSGPGMYV